MSRLTKGYLIALVGTIFWSTSAIFISYLTTTHQMPPLLLSCWRDLFVCAALLPALYFFRPALLKFPRKNLLFFVLYGLVLALFNATWSLSVKLNGAAVSTVLSYGSAGFTVLLSWWLLKERLNPPKIVGVVFSLVGCVLVANAYDINVWRANPMGISVGLFSGLLFAIFSLMGSETSRRGINTWQSLLFSFASAVVFLLVFNLIPGLPGAAGAGHMFPSLPWQGWLALAVLAFVPTIFGYGLYAISMGYLPASTANLIATSEPVFTTIQAYFILGERMGPIQITGSLLILVSVLMVRLSEKFTGKEG